MKLSKTFLLSTAAATLAFVAAPNQDANAAGDKEKCYGVAKAGKNDCGWSGGSCAGSATEDAHPETWIYLPKGACEKIVGGSLEMKAAE